MEVPGPGMEPVPQKWQHWILNQLAVRELPIIIITVIIIILAIPGQVSNPRHISDNAYSKFIATQLS